MPSAPWDFWAATTQWPWCASHSYISQTRVFIEMIEALLYHCQWVWVWVWVKQVNNFTFSYWALDHQEPYLDLMQISCIVPDTRLPEILDFVLHWMDLRLSPLRDQRKTERRNRGLLQGRMGNRGGSREGTGEGERKGDGRGKELSV